MSPSPDPAEAVVDSWVAAWVDSWGNLSGQRFCEPLPTLSAFKYTEPDNCRLISLFIEIDPNLIDSISVIPKC